jgi:hypothetical protein
MYLGDAYRLSCSETSSAHRGKRRDTSVADSHGWQKAADKNARGSNVL